MRMWMMAGAATVAGGGAWLGGAFDRGEYYPMAPTAVEARLAGLQLGSEAGDFNGESDIRLVLRQEEIRELRIGESNACRLGWTSWLGHERADGVVTLGSKIH